MASFGQVLKLPYQDWRTWGIGSLLLLIGSLLTVYVHSLLGVAVSLLLGFFVRGFALDVARSAMRKKFILPEWADLGRLFLEGLISSVIAVIWAVPSLLVGALVLGSTILALASGGLTGLGESTGALGGGVLLFVLVAIVNAYIIPAAIMSYAAEERFGAGFAFGDILRKAFSGAYVIAWLLLIVTGLLYGIVGGILNALLGWTTVVPLVYAAITGFAVSTVAMAALFGEAWG